MPGRTVKTRTETGDALPLWLIAAAAMLASSAAMPEHPPEDPLVVHAERSAPVTPFVFDGDVRDLPRPVKWQPGDPVTEIPRRLYPKPGWVVPEYQTGLDPLVELQWSVESTDSTRAFTTPSRNFPGEPYTGVNPADTVGDVGPDHYIQLVNGSGGTNVLIWDKAAPTPNPLANFTLDSLGGGFCSEGLGDPIVLYDRFADRWLLSEFSDSGNNLCVYISQTSDPVSGGWYAYGYTAPWFPDYPKYAVWPTDANGGQGSYIVTTNEDGCGVYALDRAAMLVGTAGTYQRVEIPDLPSFLFNAVTPADIDGPDPPPTGSPVIIMRHRDTEIHHGPTAPGDVLEQWVYHVDWVNAENTFLIRQPDIYIAEIDSGLCHLHSPLCFEQPNSTARLDPLGEVIMHRLQYANRLDREVLVGNLVTDVDGNDLGGVRWFELEKTVGAWVLRQEGTYSIDSDNRWMAASSMDQSGNIAVGYNVSSSSTFPSLRYTGRRFDDPLGVMTEPETVIHAGTASNSSYRYGDYSAMSVDPADDCTFWFTGMDNTSSDWRTQVVSFAFDGCGCLLFPGAPVADAVVAGDNRIDIDWNDSDLAAATEYVIRRSLTSGGPYETIAVVPDGSPGVAGGAGYTYQDTTVSGSTTYYYVVIASDGVACKTSSVEVSETATGLCTLPPIFTGLQQVSTPLSDICTLQLFWGPATPQCGGAVTYDVYRSQTAGFAPSPVSLLISGITDTAVIDPDGLVSGEVYYYIVRATDTSSGASDTNLVAVVGIPFGPREPGTWFDDAGDTGAPLMTATAPWFYADWGGHNESSGYVTQHNLGAVCLPLTSPELHLSSGSTMTFYSQHYNIPDNHKGEVQISTDGGNSWQRVELAEGYPGTSSGSEDACGLPPGTYFNGDRSDWAQYTADLSAWGDQPVLIRFAYSTNPGGGGAAAQRWWIDDISITQVGFPGTCTTGSRCTDNPFVNVEPEGPLTECAGTLLTANVAGGTGPFTFHWTQDGQKIPGATGPTYTVTDAGTYAYNCRVSAMSCLDEAFDARDTEITAANTPVFAGVVSAFDTQDPDCGLQVDWSPGSTLCDGPILYYVYRDTTTPVNPTPANLVASNYDGTSLLDAGGLVHDTTYYYLVRAMDRSMGILDSNTVEVSAVPTGPGTGTDTVYTEDFENEAAFALWTATVDPANRPCAMWKRVDSSVGRPTGSSGYYASANHFPCGQPAVDTVLESPVIDLDPPGTVLSATLELDLYYDYGAGGDTATIEVWDGAAWNLIWTDPDADVNRHQSFDVTPWAADNPDFRMRFSYLATDRWFSIDDVSIVIDVDDPCTTAFGPPPVPTGAGSTAPVIASRATSAGDVIDLGWDTTSCTATDYHLIYGDFAGVSTYAISGSECSLGTTGSYNWNAVPTGDLFFLVIGTDGAGTESSWGVDSQSGERNGLTPSGRCATIAKDVSGSCP